MRSRGNLLFCGVIVAVGMVAIPAVAQGADPFVCTTNGGGDFTVKTYGACPVTCDTSKWDDGFCGSGADCTGIEYEVIQNTNTTAAHAFAVVRDSGLSTTVGVDVFGDVNAVYPPCNGDGIIGGGQHMCHEQTISVNPFDPSNNGFRMAVKGNFVTTWSSIYFMVGKKDIQSCKIPGLGSDSSLYSGSCVPSCGPPAPYQSNIKTEIVNFEGCFAQFEYDLNSNGNLIDWGSVCKFALDPVACCQEPAYKNDVFCDDYPDSGPACDPDTEDCCNHVDYTGSTLYLTVPDPDDPTGDPLTLPVFFGDGSLGVGPDSCTCTYINGAQVCWGRRCPKR